MVSQLLAQRYFETFTGSCQRRWQIHIKEMNQYVVWGIETHKYRHPHARKHMARRKPGKSIKLAIIYDKCLPSYRRLSVPDLDLCALASAIILVCLSGSS